MEGHSKPRVIAADRVAEGVVVKFDDQTCFFFSAVLLHALAPQARPLDEDKALW